MKKEVLLQRLLALLLLAVFLFIHVMKLAHTHPRFDTSRITAGAASVDHGSDCPICDFHLSSAEIPELPGLLELKQPPVFKYVVTHNEAPVASIGHCYSDRGPPYIS